jgi:hypothetical protein
MEPAEPRSGIPPQWRRIGLPEAWFPERRTEKRNEGGRADREQCTSSLVGIGLPRTDDALREVCSPNEGAAILVVGPAVRIRRRNSCGCPCFPGRHNAPVRVRSSGQAQVSTRSPRVGRVGRGSEPGTCGASMKMTDLVGPPSAKKIFRLEWKSLRGSRMGQAGFCDPRNSCVSKNFRAAGCFLRGRNRDTWRFGAVRGQLCQAPREARRPSDCHATLARCTWASGGRR